MYLLFEQIGFSFLFAFMVAVTFEGFFKLFDYTRHPDRRLKIDFSKQ